jgi:CHAT domain-containing protein
MRFKEFGKNESYSKSLTLYAQLKKEEKNYLIAEKLLNESIALNKLIRNDNLAPNVIKALMYKELNKFDLAEKEFKHIISIDKNKDEFYWKSISELLNLLAEKGEFKEGENLIKTIDLKDIQNYKSKIEVFDSFSYFYYRLNDFDKYFDYVVEASNLRLDFYNNDHPEIAKGLNNFAMICKEIGEYDKALEYLYKALKIHTKINGENNKLTAVYLKNIGDCYLELNNFNLSQKSYNAAFNIFINDITINHVEFYSLINSLSILYYLNNQHEKAIKLYYDYIINSKNNFYFELNPDWFTTLSNYAMFLDANLESKVASNYYIKALDNFKKQSFYFIDFLSNSEIHSFWFDKLHCMDLIKSFINVKPSEFHELNSIAFNNELLIKNLTLRNQQRIKKSIEKSNNLELKEKYEQFVANKRYLTKLEDQPQDKSPENYETLKAETDILEKDITRISSTFADAKKILAITWQDIQQKLKPNEVVIDLVSYNFYNKKWTDSIMYGAFVIKKDSKFPKFVSLFEEKQLSVLLERNNKAHDSIQSKIINKQYSDKEISDLFYKPLEADLKNSTTIYLAPSGLAHQINFKALPVNTNQTLGEKYKLILLGTSAILMDYKPLIINKKDNFEIILYGGIDYNKKQVVVNKEINPNALNDLATRSGISEFNYLPGTNHEVNKINKEAITHNFKTTIITERAATEESVKQLSGKVNPFILHIATHGYFFENPKIERNSFISDNKISTYKASDDPMLRSGLLLAGANNSWRKTNNETNADDGILTAKEIANLDLSNCKLVVLSACETGLGQINGSEGVFGLQRAFKMAGVQNIIMSLWKVPDAQTAELFENFYAACFSGKSIQEAFSEAQNKMKEKYSPYYWAGFVLLE